MKYFSSLHPETFLEMDDHLECVRTAQKIFESAYKEAGIKKEVTVHSPRHSFATDLLQSGADVRVRYVQELFEHESSETTEIYAHVTTNDSRTTKSPFDLMLGRNKKNDREARICQLSKREYELRKRPPN